MEQAQHTAAHTIGGGSLTETSAILAFDVGGTRIKAGIVRGREVNSIQIEALPTHRDAASILRSLVELGRRMLAEQTVTALGISLKGIVDPQHGTILDVNESLSSLIGFPLAQSLAATFRLPAVVENDARLYTVGEMIYGAGRDAENILCFTLGTGVGCGVALGRQVIRGAHGLFGIMGGHITVQLDGPRCTCGNIGCLEAFIGTAALIRKARELYARSGNVAPSMTPQDIFAAAHAGDQTANEVVAYFTRYLSAGIVSGIHAYDPDLVILGGGLAGSSQQFLPSVQQYVHTHTWTFPRGRTQVKSAALGDTAALVGVAALARGLDVLR